MSLFVYNVFRAGEELMPPQLRRPKFIAWMRVLLRPVQYLSDLFLVDYCHGANYPSYDNSTNYVIYDRVIWQDNGVYELKSSTSTGVAPTGNSLSSTNWRKILDSFIGVDERARYTGSLIVFEYALNRNFRISAPPYIYCTPITPGASQAFVEINIPVAVWTALGPNSTSRDNRVIEFASKYTTAGRIIQITTY